MKRATYLPFLLLLTLTLSGCLSSKSITVQDADLQQALRALPKVSQVAEKESKSYAQKYELYIEQPLDYSNLSAGTFKQRVFVYHRGFDRPVVLVTEGYAADRYDNSGDPSPLASLLGANVVVVEHRYFSKSTPDPLHWDYLTVENAANDLHRITEALKTIYPKKWLSTGISKGGQTTLFYSTFFPNDMACSVPYVGPLCSSAADPAPSKYLEKLGTPEERQKIQIFQKELLKRRARLVPLLEKAIEKQGMKIRVSMDELFDNMVLEYSFALRQYNETLESMPSLASDDQTIFTHFVTKVGFDFYRTDGWNGTFFVQAVRELGFYTYDIEPFKELLTIKQCDDYVQRVHVPDGVNYSFDPKVYNKVVDYLKKSDPNILFIYGENDPWTGAAPKLPEGKKNAKVFIIPGKVHDASVTSLPLETRIEVVNQIKKWLAD